MNEVMKKPENPDTLLVLGGTSDIGRATAAIFAANGWTVQLAGRDLTALHREADDIATRSGQPVSIHHFDALDTASFAAFVDGLPALPNVVLSVIGVLGDQRRAQSDSDYAAFVMRSNYEGPSLILNLLAERFLARGSGTIIGVSSVAGDRGRGSNYIYGSAKAGFTAFLSGLRNRCFRLGVHVITVKPGFVATRMTEGMHLPAVLTVTPMRAAAEILDAAKSKKNTAFIGRRWALVMIALKLLPDWLFKRMSL
jgi:short-subunit dehydrogenase